MALIRWRPKELDPFRNLLDLQNEIFNMFNASFDILPEKISEKGTWIPSLDISEDKNNISVKLDLPGVKPDDIDISVSGNVLTIKGERKKEEESKDKNYYRLERFYGTFSRSFTLPNYIDASKIQANYKDGVLEITIPKIESAKTKEIKIKVK